MFGIKEKKEKSRTYEIGSNKHLILQNFQGEIEQELIPFNKNLGEDHPFDMEVTEGIYKEMSIVKGAVDKIIDFVWGPGFFTVCKDERAKTIIDQWLEEVNFSSIGRQWLRESLVKGSGFLELGGKKEDLVKGVKLLNANRMFILRDKKGKILNYSQIKGSKKVTSKDDIISFEPFQIAHLPINVIGDSPYGYGIVYSNLKTVNNLLGLEKNMHTLLKRKANSPLIIRAGDKEKGEYPTQEQIDGISSKLQFMNNQTEWVFPANVEASALDFGNIGDKFQNVIDHDVKMLVYGFQVPEVLLGAGNIAEGLAQVQLETFDRMIKSIQVEVEKVIEKNIFRRVLRSYNLDVHVEFEWGQPSNSEVDSKVALLTNLLNNPLLSNALRDEIEQRIALLLGFDPQDMESSEEERDREEDEPQPRVPGQNQNEYVEGRLIY